MTRNLHKVQKQVAKKRGGKPTNLHENCKDSRRLQRAGDREEKLARQLVMRSRANEPYLERMKFFQEMFSSREAVKKPHDDMQYLHDVVHLFTSRYDSEFLLLKNSRRPGRPPSAREVKLKDVMETESKECNSGFWIPDITDTKTIEKLYDWDGRWESLNKINFVRFHGFFKHGDERTVTKSRFPPNGLS